MKNWDFYRLALHFLPKQGRMNESTFPAEQTHMAEKILRRHRCVGATVCLFSARGMEQALSFGDAKRKNMKAEIDTVYRVASISKFVTALGAMRLCEKGVLDLDEDINAYLPFGLRHPKAPKTPITLRMLLSHTAGLQDGRAYQSKVGSGAACSALLKEDSFCAHLPGEKWEYSNFGAGIAGAAMEASGADFETLMQKTLFAPLGVQATYYPQKTRGLPLADAYRVLPPHRHPQFNAAVRQSRPLPAAGPDPETHYALAHGNLCISAPELSKIGAAAMRPGFLTDKSLQEMRRAIAPFGERAQNLSEGIGTFILRDDTLFPRPLYGHQGMAYGAVHGLFFDPVMEKGLIVLTSGASEARHGVLADLNRDLLKAFIRSAQ